LQTSCPASRPPAPRRTPSLGVANIADKTLVKARKLALAVGALAGAFGSLVGVGGGVLISPIIANICT
jgi:uncharacterized membrane protein YfcA